MVGWEDVEYTGPQLNRSELGPETDPVGSHPGDERRRALNGVHTPRPFVLLGDMVGIQDVSTPIRLTNGTGRVTWMGHVKLGYDHVWRRAASPMDQEGKQTMSRRIPTGPV